MRRAAEAAADVIRAAESTRATLKWEEKGVADFVTDVDRNAEAAAIEVLGAAEPGAMFQAEESTATRYPLPDTPHPIPHTLFVIDPLDGTTNFLHGLPDYAVSIGAVVDGALAAGVVLHVPRNECFTAFAGGGAWAGDERIRVSHIADPRRALIGTGFPFKAGADIPAYVAQLSRVMAATSGVRRPGAASIDLANVAAGRLDGFWENALAPWDVAAGILLIREAGGVCTDAAGHDATVTFGSIVAGNAAIHPWLLSTLRP